MVKLVDLRPDRNLLNSNFDGYKLSLQKIETITEELEVPIDKLIPSENQYSLLHAKLFLLQNFLYGEIEHPESVYFIDKSWNIQKYTIDTTVNSFEIETLWQIPLRQERQSGSYNVSMHLPTEKLALVADGMGFLYVLDRGCRQNSDNWQVLFSADVLGPDQTFLITDSVYCDSIKPELHLLLTSIRRNESSDKFSTILNWVTLEKDDVWNQTALRELKVDGFIQYANLERTCKAVYVVSDSGCKFVLDSEKEIVEEPEETAVPKKYTWTQAKEDVTINIPLHEGTQKSDIKVHTLRGSITIKCGEATVVEGPLYQGIDSDLTCWTFTANILEIVLHKLEAGLMWPELISGDVSGEYVPNAELVRSVADRLAPFTSENEAAPVMGTTFNSQEVEECDFECDKLSVFERLDVKSHKATHKINLGSHQILLTVNLDRTSCLALGTRSDVDACIWQPTFESDFSMVHTGTLLSLAYIQASKQQRKFFACSPDMGYSVICDNKHIFIYCQNKAIGSNELRNRTSGRRVTNLAQQQVYSLPSNDEIFGIFVSNTYIYVLGLNFLTALRL